MPCRLIISPVTKQEVTSKTWDDIHQLTKNEDEADRIYSMLTSRPFLAWFGDWVNDPQNASKVVNDLGEPKLVYHGTLREFHEFDPKAVGEYSWRNAGFHFSDSKGVTSQYTQGAHTIVSFLDRIARSLGKDWNDGRTDPEFVQKVMDKYNEVVLDLARNKEKSQYFFNTFGGNIRVGNESAGWEWVSNIFNGAFPEEGNLVDLGGILVDKRFKIEGNQMPVFLNIRNPYVRNLESVEIDNLDNLNERGEEARKDLGTDGTIINFITQKISTYVAFDPNQIKSVFNRGSFLAANNDVTIEAGYPFGSKFIVRNKGQKVGEIITNNTGEYLDVELAGIVKFSGDVNVGTNAYLQLAKMARGHGLMLRSDRENIRMSEAAKRLWTRFVAAGQAELINNRYVFTGSSDSVTNNIYSQQEDTEGSTASADTLAKISEFLKRIGVDVRKVNNVVVNGQKLTANGVADIMNRLIQIVNGKENVALTEEAAHFAVEIIEQTNLPLFNQMMNKVASYEMYKSVFAKYKDIYKDADGKPDVRKIKKEALGKILAEYVVKQNEGTIEKPDLLLQSKNWWDAILDFLKQLFGRAGFNPFEEAAKDILKGDVGGTAADINTNSIFLQASNSSESVFNKLKAKHDQISKKEIVDPQDASKLVEKYFIEGKQVANRVTDKAKAYEEKLFGKKEITAEQMKTWDIKKEKGTQGHQDFEDIFNMYIDKDTGLRRDIPLDRPNPANIGLETAWKKLHDNFVDRLNTFPAGTRFMSEVRIYDEVTDTAGTMDFVAITPDGAVSIYDYKFIDINVEKTKDIPWYKKRAFNIQLGAYKDILSRRYGVKNFKQVRVIPIQAQYAYSKKKDKTSPIVIKGVNIGDVNVQNIKHDYLLPFALSGESTGNPELDRLIDKLEAILHKIEVGIAKKGEQFEKYEQINTLTSAIRKLQIQGNASLLAEQGLGLIRRYRELIKTYNTTFEGKDPKDIPIADQEKMAEELFDAHSILDVYTDIDIILQDSIDKKTEDGKKLLEKLQDLSSNSRLIKRQIEDVSKRLSNDFIAKGVGIKGLLNPERSITYLKKMFRSFSQAQTAATRALYKIVDPILHKTSIEYFEETRKLEHLKKSVEEWAKAKGISTKNIFKPVLSYDSKGRWTGRLIDKLDAQYYTEFKNATEAGDKKWFQDNIDLEAYREWYKDHKEKRIAKINEGRFLADDEANEKKKKQLISDFEKEHDIDKHDSAYGNWRMKQLAIEDKWRSKEFGELIKPENKPMLDFYNYMQEKLRESYDAGLLKAWQYRTFVPNVRASVVERAVFGGKARSSWVDRNLGAQPDDQIYGHKDPLTGEVIDTLGAWYLSDIGVKVVEGEDEFVDYSEKSMDLFKSFSLWNEQLIKYRYLSEIESRVNLLHMTEGLKRSIATNQFGNPLKERDASGKIIVDRIIEIENNRANQDYLKKFIDYYLYGKQMTDAASLDVMIPNALGKITKAINNKAGFKVLPEFGNTEGHFSLAKTISAMNRFFQMKVLGLNVTTAISNLVGGSINAHVAAGRFYTKSDLAISLGKLGSTKFWGDEESKVLAGLLDRLAPLTDNRKIEEARNLSVSNAVKYLSTDWMFSLQRSSDKFVQYPIAISTIMNSTIVDNKIVNIRELVRQQNGYEKIYDLPQEEQKALRDKIEKEIDEMKKTSSLIKLCKIVDDKIVIPGVDIDEEAGLRNFIQQLSKDAIGNSTRDDISQIRLSLIGQSVMMFKNWIPRLVDTRFGELRYNIGTDQYEYGRARMFMKVVSKGIFSSIGRINGMLKGSEKGIAFMKELYEQKVQQFEARGEEFHMTEQQFIDMYISGVRAELRELGALLSLFGMFWFMKANAPDDDEDDRTKGFAKWATRLTDKATQELSFFYSPTSIAQVGNGSLFPSLGFLVDLQNIVKHTGSQAFGFVYENAVDEEAGLEIQESAKPLKYIFKTFPITKEGLTWLAVFNKDLADEMGIKLSSDARINR